MRTAPLLLAVLAAACSPDNGVTAYNNEPEAKITSHAEGSHAIEGVTTTLRGAVSDPDDGPDELLAAWYVDNVQACEPAAPDDNGLTFCDVQLSPGDVEITLEVQDTRNAAGQDAVEIVVDPNAPPSAVIVKPTEGQAFYADQKISFDGLVADEEDAPSALTAWWESDLQGELKVNATPDGSGNVSGSGYLEQGAHSLTLRVEDTAGKTGLATVNIDVGPPNSPPLCAITSPVEGDTGTAGEVVVFAGTGSDPDIAPNLLSATWTSDKDGVIGEVTPDSDGTISFPFAGLSSDTHDITLTVSDELGLTCTDSVLYTIGEAPSVVITAPSTGSTVNQGASTVFSATISDDGPPNAVSLTWTSDLDGVISTAPADGAGNASFTTSALSYGFHTVILSAVDGDGLTGQATTTFTVNAVPTAPTVTVSPDPATTTQDLVAVASGATDPDGSGPISYTYAWFEDGSPSGASTTDVFPAAATTKGRTYSVQVAATDGVGTGPTATDDADVVNSAPVLASVTIDPPTGAGVTATLTCLASASDVDGDTPALDYLWEDVTTASVLGTADTVVLTPAVVALGDEVRCTVTATDDEGLTDTGSASVVLDNVPPSLDSISITPPTGVTTSTTLTCLATASDLDGPTPAITYLWEETGTGAVLGTSDVLALTPAIARPGDVVRCTATATDGGGSSDSASATVNVENTNPVVDSISISPSSGVTTSTTLTCSGTASDADGGSPTITYRWDDVTSGASLGTAAIITLDPARVDAVDDVQCTVTATDTDGGTGTATAVVNIGNTAPSNSTVSITPTPAHAGDTLVCSWSGYADADGDPDLSQIEWAINGLTSGTSATLSSGFDGGDTVSCTVTPYDGVSLGAPVTASTVIENSAPVLASVALTPDPGHEDDTLVCAPGSVTDADGTSAFGYTYAWSVGGATIAATSSTLDDSWFARGDTVRCTVTPNDGIDDGAPVNSNVIDIENSLPTVASVTISPSPATADDVLSCSWSGFYDADGDPDLTGVAWYVNGTLAGTSTVLSSGFGGGDLVECTASPFDGIGYGPTRTASVVIGNTPPSIDSVFIDPDPAYAGDTLTCGWSGFDDPDLDPDASYAQWTIDGASAGTGTTLITALVQGQIVRCTVTPFDGSSAGTPVYAEIEVSNSLPVLSSATLSPDPAYEATSLTCAPGATSDIDGTSLFSYSYTWTVSGAAVAATGDTLDGAWFDKGDTVQCTAIPNDGIDDGVGVASNVVSVLNTPPTVSTVTVVPDPAEKSDPLTCTWSGFSDDDGDSDLSYIEWTVNGASAGGGATLSSGYRGGDVVSCIVNPYDGTDLGTPTSYTLTITNNLPVMTSVFLSPESPDTNDTVTVVAAATDPDGDALTYHYTWYVDGVPNGATGNTLSGATWFDKHEDIWVVVTPDDGYETGATMTSNTVTAVNTAPEASVLTIEPPGPTEFLDDLVCTVAAAGEDIDGDTLVHSVTWQVDGAAWAGPVTSTFEPGDTILAEDTYAGTWECTAAPFDGEVYGPSSSADTVVGICADQYLVFDGLDDYVSLGSGDNLLGLTNDFTVSAWIYKDSGSYIGTILDAESSRSGVDAENAGFRFWVNDTDKLKAFYGTGADPYWDSEGWTTQRVALDAWTHVVVTRTGRDMELFFDGVRKYFYEFHEPEDINWDGAGYETDHYQVGRYEVLPEGSGDPSLEPQEFFDGSIAHLGVWSRVLTADEIATLASTGLDGDPNLYVDLAGYWPMTEGTGTVVYDISGNGHDGVVYGPAWVDPCPPLWGP